MGEQKEMVVRRSVSLRPEDELLVREFAEQHGLDFSSALRFIVNEWAQWRTQRPEALAARGEGEVSGKLDG